MDYKSIIEKSTLFDENFYIEHYRDVRMSDELPLEHFVNNGLKEDRKPNEWFDPVWYREYYEDIKNSGVIPFIHYLTSGLKEFRFANENEKKEYESLQGSFDILAYKNRYEELANLEDDFDFLWHYVHFGISKEKMYLGFVDKIENDTLFGWAYNESNPSENIALDIFMNGIKIATILANKFRQDLKDAKIGNGKYGFELNISKYIKEEKSVEFFVKITDNGEQIGSIKYYLLSILNNESKNTLIEKFQNFLEQINYDKLNNSGYRINKDANTYINEKLFEIKDNSEVIEKYMEYVFYRYKLEKSFSLKKVQEKFSFLDWYFLEYGKIRKEYTIPIGKQTIDKLNANVDLIASKNVLSQYHMYFLKTTNQTTHLENIVNDYNTYINTIYSWSVDHIASHGLADCLIPDSYIENLKKINYNLGFKKYPLSYFATIYHANNVKYHFLDLHNETHRLIYYCVLIIDSYIDTRFDILRYIPDDILKNILKKNILHSLYKELYEVESEDLTSKNIENIFLNKAFDLKKQVFLTKDINGNRSESAKYLGLYDGIEECDIQIIGPFEKASGLGQACRLSATALEKAGFSVNRVDFDLDNPAPEGFNAKESLSELKSAKINLIHLNAESIPLVFAYLPNVFEKSYNIGYFYWELDSPAKCHDLALEMLDEIWVSTQYGIDQYKEHTKLPISNVGMAYEELPQISKTEAKEFLNKNFGIDTSKTIFLTTFDSFSFIQRKNPLGVLRAFQDAFKDNNDVILLIKTHNKDKIGDPVQLEIWKEIDSIIDLDERIVLVNETFQYEDLLKFKKGADAYITLHRSEGWGFGMIEAMNLEIPVIATGYSGNLEFTKEDNSWLVDYDEVYLEQDDYIFVKTGQKWAEPKIESAAKALQEAYDNPSLREEKAKKAKEFIQKHFSIERIAERYGERVNEILNEEKKC